MKEADSDLFLYHVNERIKKHPRTGCRLFSDLTIDEQCNVVTCCAIERDHADYKITNIFDSDFVEKLERWQPGAVCHFCMASGMSPLDDIEDSTKFPKELYLTPNLRNFSQRLLLYAEKAVDRLIKRIRRK